MLTAEIFTRVLLTQYFDPGIIFISYRLQPAMTDFHPLSYTSFDGPRRIASGSLATNALAIKHAFDAGPSGPLLTFDDQTGRVVDLDLRGSEAEIIGRLPQENTAPGDGQTASPIDEATPEQRGRGRPKLGVVAREITLLPRHWDWLAAQPGGASVTLRKLVDQARRANTEKDARRQAQERAYRFMSAMAGDLPDFEEASRALFADDSTRFQQCTETWPNDIRDHVRHLANPVGMEAP